MAILREEPEYRVVYGDNGTLMGTETWWHKDDPRAPFNKKKKKEKEASCHINGDGHSYEHHIEQGNVILICKCGDVKFIEIPQHPSVPRGTKSESLCVHC